MISVNPGSRILIVDDQSETRGAFVAALTASGYRTVQARTIFEAIGTLERVEPVHAVVTHAVATCGAPSGAGGRDLYTEMKLRWPQIPVIMLSGRGDRALAPDIASQAASQPTPKSVRPSELVRSVREALAVATTKSMVDPV